MKDILMEAFKLGLGAADMTREQAEKLVKKVQKRYPSEIKDGRKMVNELVAHAKKRAKTAKAKAKAAANDKDVVSLRRSLKKAGSLTAKLVKRAVKGTKRKTAKKSTRKRTTRRKATRKK